MIQEYFSKLGCDTNTEGTNTCSRLRVLSLSCVFPNEQDPQYGIFVRCRLQALADLAEVQVLAPIPLLDWAKHTFRSREAVAALRQDEKLLIHHPRWFYPPLGGGLNAVFLFARLLAPVLRLRRLWKFDLIDAHFAYPDGIAAAMLSAIVGAPFSVTLRGNEVMHAKSPMRRLLIGWALRRAARIITVAESLRSFAISMGVPPQRVKVIPNGVSTHLFFPEDREDCRQRIGLQPGEKMILSAGALIERKGHHHVIQALKDLPDNVRLFIAGGPGREGNFEVQIRQRMASSGFEARVKMLGAVSPKEMVKLMSAADLLCLASSREGWPNVVHEAMACGTPVVATRVGGVPEMIPSPSYGILVPVNEGEALSKALNQGLTQNWDRRLIAQWAHSRPWEKVACEVLQELQQFKNIKE
jgi:glycosyltransferase involved in cell wall biosynthesis